jgi:hypothetical protein
MRPLGPKQVHACTSIALRATVLREACVQEVNHLMASRRSMAAPYALADMQR